MLNFSTGSFASYYSGALQLLLLLLLLFPLQPTSASFVATTTPALCTRTPLFGYRDEFGEGSRRNDGYGDEASQQKPRIVGFNVPLIGPIPGGTPLLMGSELHMEPTPMQWKALEESVLLHRKYLKEQENSTITGIDAAPLVAIIDEVSGQSVHAGRYATIAAVVGISNKNGRSAKIDTSDEASFMESMNQFGTQGYVTPLTSNVRLVGVARATLGELFYKMPSMDEVETTNDIQAAEEDKEEDEEEDFIDEEEDSTPIVMAQFTLLTDSTKKASNPFDSVGDKGAKSFEKAPIHALNEMSNLANKVMRIHEDRRRLVLGLSAAKARLNHKNVYEDTDGLGQLQQEKEQAAVDYLLSRYDSEECFVGGSSRLAGLDNYGLNYYSRFSSILALTNVAMEIFAPYYSPKRQQTEEYRFEILSFVAFRALEGFCKSYDLAWALRCANSAERLSKAYELMLEHVILLEEMAKQASCDLRDCGEECTDLW